ncbi:MAG TPA: peroxiredoxin-like family protein [Candidatus Acidoferrales bacterium]|nr:peroxiredoxin-like family protein [Candidatus Acidoferrales bacterium]
MRETLPRFTELGIRVACVVQGTAIEMARFCGRHGVEAICIPDPDLHSYRAMGFERTNWWSILFPKPEGRRRRAAAKAAGCPISLEGTLQKHSDVLQLPGASLVAPGGKILWLHRGTATYDLPAPAELLTRVSTQLAGR